MPHEAQPEAQHAAQRARSTPRLLRVYRVARSVVHVAEGLATIAIAFPWITQERRFALIGAWSRRLLRIFAIETLLRGALAERGPPLMLAANHVSWLDIFVLHSIAPSRFIAKAELRRWPILGWLITGTGTLYIERDRRQHMHAVNAVVRDVLARGHLVTVFPEGRTSDGQTVLPFHGSLLQPVIDVDGALQPVALGYRGADGQPGLATVFDDVHFLGSVWRITGEPVVHVDVHLLAAMPAGGTHRRELARRAEVAIRRALA